MDVATARQDDRQRPYAPSSQTTRVTAVGSKVAEIRTAALELFAMKGYPSTTVTDIADRVGIRGPSLYRHISSKQELLRDVMLTTMERLSEEQRAAIASTSDVSEQLRRAVEAHVRYHARHQYEAFVGSREIRHLEEPNRSRVVESRAEYEQTLRQLIERGIEEERFQVDSARLASYAILDMGIGVAMWFREHGALTADEVAYRYGDFAMSIVQAR